MQLHRVDKALPVFTTIEPELPEVAAPLFKDIAPLAPFAPAPLVTTENAPLDEAPEALARETDPPVASDELPAVNVRRPPDP